MKDKWIKVNDRLPDNDGEVLVYHYKPIYKEWELAIAYYDEILGEFWTTNGWKVHPTYWMPIELPEDDCKGMDSKLSSLAKPCPNFTPKEE